MKLVKLGIAVFCLLSIISPAKSQDSQQPIEVIPAVESVSYDGAATSSVNPSPSVIPKS